MSKIGRHTRAKMRRNRKKSLKAGQIMSKTGYSYKKAIKNVRKGK